MPTAIPILIAIFCLAASPIVALLLFVAVH